MFVVFYFVVLGLVFVVAIAAMIISVISSQNKVRSVFAAWTVISSSISRSAFSSHFYVCYMEVFSR